MKHLLLVAAAALTVCTPSATMAVEGPLFGCDARAPNICRFRIFYDRGDRIVILLPGMKQRIPEIEVGHNYYCVVINKTPPISCTRKLVNAKYNN